MSSTCSPQLEPSAFSSWKAFLLKDSNFVQEVTATSRAEMMTGDASQSGAAWDPWGTGLANCIIILVNGLNPLPSNEEELVLN